MIYILIPVFNEAANLENLAKNLQKSLKSIKLTIIVDDGSTDSTILKLKKLSKSYPIKRIGYKKNKGAGYAFKFGFDYLIPKLKSNDVVVTMEGDNTTDYSILPKMLSLVKKGTVVLASPHAGGGSFKGVSSLRVLISRMAAEVDSNIFRVKNVKTYSSFYRAYPAKDLIRASKHYGKSLITHHGFSAGVELIIKLSNLGSEMKEVPSVVDWTKRKGKSKMNLKKNALAHFNLYTAHIGGNFR